MAWGIPRHRMRHRVTIQRNTVSRDAGGSPVDSWAALITNEPCSIVQNSESESRRYGRENIRRGHSFYFRAVRVLKQAVAAGDRIRWVDGTTTRTFDIQSVIDANLQNRIVRVFAEETL